jgi:hypothetical protein
MGSHAPLQIKVEEDSEKMGGRGSQIEEYLLLYCGLEGGSATLSGILSTCAGSTFRAQGTPANSQQGHGLQSHNHKEPNKLGSSSSPKPPERNTVLGHLDFVTLSTECT